MRFEVNAINVGIGSKISAFYWRQISFPLPMSCMRACIFFFSLVLPGRLLPRLSLPSCLPHLLQLAIDNRQLHAYSSSTSIHRDQVIKNMTSSIQQEQRLGIMSAMAEEVDSLLSELSNHTSEVHGKRTYYKGRLFNKVDVVIVFSRWGKVAAAATTAILIERYNCQEIIFTGVAGGVKHGLNVGDVVVADRLVQHDMNATPIFKRFEIPLLGVGGK